MCQSVLIQVRKRINYLGGLPKYGKNLWNERHFYGSIQASITVYDQKKNLFHTIHIFKQAKDDEMVHELFKSLLSKFSTYKSDYIKYGIYLFRSDKSVEAREVLKRALKSLPQRKHIPIISKFGQLEYHFGQVEVARSMFEDLISTFPKRIDIHQIYIDQEKRLGNVEKIRALYDRVTSLSLSTKKMKFLFKQYLQFEEDHGTEERMEYVKQKAIQYVESKN